MLHVLKITGNRRKRRRKERNKIVIKKKKKKGRRGPVESESLHMAPTELTDWLESKTSKLTWLFQPFMISIRNRYMRPDPTFSPVSWLPASPVFLTSRQHIFYKTHLSQPFQRHSFITVPTLFRFSLDREASFFYYFLFAARLS